MCVDHFSLVAVKQLNKTRLEKKNTMSCWTVHFTILLLAGQKKKGRAVIISIYLCIFTLELIDIEGSRREILEAFWKLLEYLILYKNPPVPEHYRYKLCFQKASTLTLL